VRLGRHVTLEQRVSLTVFFGGFASLDSGTGDKGVARLQIQKHHVTVFWVNAFFHDDSCFDK
jgi:hypothetical protein